MTEYRIMHMDRTAAVLDSAGACRIPEPAFLPKSLFLVESEELEDRVQNLTNFWYWCASRLLTIDRQYYKEIMNSIGASQGKTDRERAQVALSYHCLSLTDAFWVREAEDRADWAGVNLYDNHLGNAFADISLRGKQISATNRELAPDLSTGGQFPKAWIRRQDGFVLLKDGGREAVEREVLASKVLQCFDVPQVHYAIEEFEGEPVSASRIFTDKEYGILTREAFETYAVNHDIDPLEYIKKLDKENYYKMNLLDYLVGNTDRHWGNWGFLVDNKTNTPIKLHPLMDFNRAFLSYDTVDGAGCLPEFPRRISQRQAAEEAVQVIGWPQIAEIKKEWFAGHEDWYDMLKKRTLIFSMTG